MGSASTPYMGLGQQPLTSGAHSFGVVAVHGLFGAHGERDSNLQIVWPAGSLLCVETVISSSLPHSFKSLLKKYVD